MTWRMKRTDSIIIGTWRTLARLPLWMLYRLSDVLYLIVAYVVRYRLNVVRLQLAECFPEKSKRELRSIERRFYHYFCDYILETIHFARMSEQEMRRRVEWVGLDKLQEEMKRQGKPFGLVYLGHYGNWEWMTSFSLWLQQGVGGSQIYHPLKNATIDQAFLDVRERFGGKCVPMKQTLRHIIMANREGRSEVIGFIADQSPKWEAMHQWCRFLNHETSFFIGVEKIAKQVDAVVAYVDVSRPRRGYYHAELVPVSSNTKDLLDYTLTDRYAELLEATIRREPHLWLWTHKRWKRTKEEWERRQASHTNAEG